MTGVVPGWRGSWVPRSSRGMTGVVPGWRWSWVPRSSRGMTGVVSGWRGSWVPRSSRGMTGVVSGWRGSWVPRSSRGMTGGGVRVTGGGVRMTGGGVRVTGVGSGELGGGVRVKVLWITRKSSSLRDVDPLCAFWAHVFRAWADDAVLRALFLHVRGPAGDAGHDEDWGEEFGGDAHEVVGAGVEEVGVGEQFLLAPHHFLDALGDRIEPGVPHVVGEAFGPGFDEGVARVLVAVDGVAKAHDLFLAREHVEDGGLRFVRRLPA